MFRISLLIAIGLGLAGCLPVSTYYREGVSLATVERDELRCEVAALRDAPVHEVVRQGPPVYVPGKQVCTATGVCSSTPGHYVPGEIYTVDRNKSLRQSLARQCMVNRGYAPVEIPACPNAVAQAAPAPSASDRLPKLTPESCAIRTPGGGIQIVTQG